MALRGNLKDFGLPDVFQLVQLSRKTGVLRIVGEDAEGSIWFRDGEVFFAQSNWRRDHLGERLVNAQRITPAALARALELHAGEPEGGRRLGQILVDEGYITQQILESFVQEQIQDTIFDLMRWDAGDFDFEVLPDVVHEDIGLSVSVENIVMEGSRRLEEWNRIKKRVPSVEMVFKMATAPGEGTFEISLKPVEWNLLLLIDGTRSVSDLAHATHRTDFEVARVIYGLFSAGLLEVPGDDEVERLRSDRTRREEKRAALDVRTASQERPAFEEGSAPGPDVEAPPVDAAGEEGSAEPPTAAAEAAIAQPAAAGPVEEPEFLSSPGLVPTADDMAVFEQMMGAVLAPHADEVVPVIPAEDLELPAMLPDLVLEEMEVPAPEPEVPVAEEFEGVGAISAVDVSQIPAPPVAEAYAPPEGFVSSGDFETDLRTLGLGELPAELAAPEPAVEPEIEYVPASEMADLEVAELAEGGDATEVAGAAQVVEEDLDELIRSLDQDASPAPAAGVISSGTDYGTEDAGEVGVISTDAFLADFDSDMGLSGGLGDELTALTGGGTARARPVATVAKIPEPGDAVVLHRDQLVDRTLIERIIEGIENL